MSEFVTKHGPENLICMDGAAMTFRGLLDEVGSAPFIASKRLVVVSSVPKFTREEVDLLGTAIHPDCIVLFCDPRPDKRLQGVKALLQVAVVKEFVTLGEAPLRAWLRDEARNAEIRLEPQAAETLIAVAGVQQDMLAQELQKLALYAGGNAVTEDHVTLLAVPSGEQEVWTVTQLLSRGDRAGALRYARSLLQHGEDAFSLWNVLLWYVRCLSAVALAVRDGHRNPAKIASVAGVPFPTARMLLTSAQEAPLHGVRALVDWAVVSDRELKTGGYRATGESPQELVALIDELILRCCALKQGVPTLRSG